MHHFSWGSSGSCHFRKDQFVKPLEQVKCFLIQCLLRDSHISPPNSSRESDWNTWKIQRLAYASKDFDCKPLKTGYQFWERWNQHTPSCLFYHITQCNHKSRTDLKHGALRTLNCKREQVNWGWRLSLNWGWRLAFKAPPNQGEFTIFSLQYHMACTHQHSKTQNHIPSVNWKSSERSPLFLDWGAAKGVPEGQRVEKSPVFLIFFFSPTPASKQYCYRSTVMAAVSRQAPKTLREGTLPVIRRAWLQGHFSSSLCPLAALPCMQIELLKVCSRAGKIKPKLSG